MNKPKKVKAKISRTVTEVAIVSLDRDGCVDEIFDIIDEHDSCDEEVISIIETLSIHD